MFLIILGFEELSVRKYTAKIGYKNQTSQNMFTKMGFKQVCLYFAYSYTYLN